MVNRFEQPCIFCGCRFVGIARLYCTQECRSRAKAAEKLHAPKQRSCLHCGQTYTPTGGQKFCTPDCVRTAKSAEQRAERAERRKTFAPKPT